jgi:hypothetical protein
MVKKNGNTSEAPFSFITGLFLKNRGILLLSFTIGQQGLFPPHPNDVNTSFYIYPPAFTGDALETKYSKSNDVQIVDPEGFLLARYSSRTSGHRQIPLSPNQLPFDLVSTPDFMNRDRMYRKGKMETVPECIVHHDAQNPAEPEPQACHLRQTLPTQYSCQI